MDDARLVIRLKPRAKNDRIAVGPDGVIDAAVTSPPVDGRANDRLIALLAGRLGVPKGRLSIIKGGRSRNKVVAVDGMTQKEAMHRILTP